jgi:hypothetical protein
LNRLTFYIKQLENLVKTKPKNCGGAIEAKPMQHILRGPWWWVLIRVVHSSKTA